MQKIVVKVIVILAALLALGACGDGGGSGTDTSASAKAAVTSVNWYFDNRAPDLSNNGATCFLVLESSYSDTISQSDIASFSVTAPTGWHWTATAPNLSTRTTSDGKHIVSASLYFGQNPQALPLAGTWTAALTLKDGQTATTQRTFREPGSTAAATHQYLYTEEDWTPSANQQQYVAALRRFPAAGYTVQYSSTDGGKITTTGLAPVMAGYLQGEPRVYNLRCFLYDQNKTYLGYTTPQFSTVDHSPTSLITDGEISIVPAATTSVTGTSTGKVDLAAARYLRFVYYDGGQFAPTSYSTYDNRSLSSLVPVN